MIGKSIFHFVDAESAHVQNITASDPSHSGSFEMRLHSSEGQAVLTLLNVTRNFRPDGTYDGMLAMVTDITERKKAEEELKKLSLIARSTTNAIIITNPHQRIEWVNDAFCRITGYTLDEVIGKTMSFLFGEQTDRHTETVMNDSIRFHQPFTYEIVKYTKSGVPFWVEIQGRPVFDEDGKLSYYFNMETDVTERKRAFSELQKKENQIRIFARQLNHMLEEERSRIAREIHDEFGQQLMGLKMSLSYLEKLEHLPGGAAGVIRELRSGVENTFQSLRSFATELRPGILDTLGLIPSIEWLVRGFEKKSGISCVVDLDVKQQMFDWDLSIAYFRICQEALTNIVKHAHATEVKISVIEDEDFLCMRIDDNGTGMRAENVDTPFSLGLLGMQERARLIGGELTINSQPGEGTSIYLKTKTHDA
jgi:PAS domain S-box-containing protein